MKRVRVSLCTGAEHIRVRKKPVSVSIKAMSLSGNSTLSVSCTISADREETNSFGFWCHERAGASSLRCAVPVVSTNEKRRLSPGFNSETRTVVAHYEVNCANTVDKFGVFTLLQAMGLLP